MKKIITIFLTVLLMFCIVGCQQDSTRDNDGNANSTATSDGIAQTETTTPESRFMS